jgi:hypothetical protein
MASRMFPFKSLRKLRFSRDSQEGMDSKESEQSPAPLDGSHARGEAQGDIKKDEEAQQVEQSEEGVSGQSIECDPRD